MDREARQGKAIDIYRAYFKKCWELTRPGSSFGFPTLFLGPLFLTSPLVSAGGQILRSFARARHVLDGDASTGA